MGETLSRRMLLERGTAVVAGLLGLSRTASALSPKTPMLVYKDPNCGCCEKWVGLMRAAGFELSVRNTSDMDSIKRRYGVGAALASCHTALVGGYVIEGHVPADLTFRLLKEKPKIAGLTVPGMVTGSPGMEGPNPERYQVLSFDAAGKTAVYARR
jgi:hypothetical protein